MATVGHQSCLEKIRDARTINEVMRLLSPTQANIASIGSSLSSSQLPKQKRSVVVLASMSSKDIDMGALALEGRRNRPVRSATTGNYEVVNLDKVDTKNNKERAAAASNMAIIDEALKELRAAYAVVSRKDFSQFKNSARAASTIKALIAEAGQFYRELAANARAPETEVPGDHLRGAKAVNRLLKTTLSRGSYSKITVANYVIGAKQGHQFTTYQSFITVSDFTTEEGFQYPNYTFVYTTTVDMNTGKSVSYITTNPEIKTPGSFPFGTEVKSDAQLKSSVHRLLAIDDNPLFGDRRAVGHDTNYLRKHTALGLKTLKIGKMDREVISNVRVQNNIIYVRLVKGMSPRETHTAITEIRNIINSMYNSKSAGSNNVTMRKLVASTGEPLLAFTLQPSRGTQQGINTVRRIDEVASLLNLDADETRKLKAAMKSV